jgi:hypothetical protein
MARIPNERHSLNLGERITDVVVGAGSIAGGVIGVAACSAVTDGIGTAPCIAAASGLIAFGAIVFAYGVGALEVEG